MSQAVLTGSPSPAELGVESLADIERALLAGQAAHKAAMAESERNMFDVLGIGEPESPSLTDVVDNPGAVGVIQLAEQVGQADDVMLEVGAGSIVAGAEALLIEEANSSQHSSLEETTGGGAGETEASEKYAHSMRTARLVGRLMLEGAAPQEVLRARQGLRNDFITRIAEMMKTDPEFRHQLDIEHEYELPVVEGIARNPLDESEIMVDMLLRARDEAVDAARNDPKMWTEVVRSTCDVGFAGGGDALVPGRSLLGCTMFPKQAMERDRDGVQYWEGKGYRWGLVFFPYQSKAADGSRLAGVVSIDAYDEDVLRAVLSDYGMHIPADESTDKWLSHAIEVDISAEDARDVLRAMRQEYYRRVGNMQRRLSVTEYIDQNIEVAQNFFESFYLKMAESVYSGKLHPDLSHLIQEISASAPKLKDEVKQQLAEVRRTGVVGDVDGRALDELICYATVEQLRKGLPEVLDRLRNEPVTSAPVSYHVANIAVPTDVREAARLAGRNVGGGTSAGRSYGGCTQGVKLTGGNAAEGGDGIDGNNLDKDGGEEDANPNSLVRCPKCNVRSPISKVAKKDKWECPHCNYSVDICTGEVKNEGAKAAKKSQHNRLAEFFGATKRESNQAERAKLKKKRSAQAVSVTQAGILPLTRDMVDLAA